jgi:hypothetical protein
MSICDRSSHWVHVGESRPGVLSVPLTLTDEELAAVQAAAAPIHPNQRDAFLKALAAELEKQPAIGPGVVHRCAAALQKTFVVAAYSERLAPRRAGQAAEGQGSG